MRHNIIALVAFICLLPSVHAVSSEVISSPTTYILISAVILALASIISLQTVVGISEKHKKVLFFIITAPVVLSTAYLGIHTVYDNITSVTKGPVHWHADYQIWLCGERADLVNPRFPSNKIGTPVLHEHNDDRIHIEGNVGTYDEITLSEYFRVIGGELSNDAIVYRGVDGVLSYKNGDACAGQGPGTLKVFVNGTRIENPADYVIDGVTIIPTCETRNGRKACHGDCFIVVYDDTDDMRTDRICESLTAKGVSYADYEGSPWQ